MKNFIGVFVGMVLFGLVAEAHAGQRWFVDEPEFMKHPDTIECEVVNRGSCGLFKTGSVIVVDPERVLYTNGQDMWVDDHPILQSVVCRDGLCHSDLTGFIGRLNHNTSVAIPIYYYIGGGSRSTDHHTLVLHKRGTGPMAEQIKGWYVEGATTTQSSTEEDLFNTDFDAWLLQMAQTHGIYFMNCRSGTSCDVSFGTEDNPVDHIMITRFELEAIEQYYTGEW